MMKRSLAVFLIVVVFLFLIISGCSSGTRPSLTSSATPTSSAPATWLPAEGPIDGEPVAPVSVVGPIPPYNPGGPVVEVTLKNVGSQPVISLEAILMPNRGFVFTFDVTPSTPLLPGNSTSVRQTLIGGGFSDNINYPLMIRGTLQNQVNFTYTKPMQVVPPAQ